MDAPVKEGDVLAGRYQVERVLAAGGMGVVVAAKHVQLGQRVALKFLLPTVASTSEAAAGRFQREARAAALLRSEHVARVIDVGTLENGAPYMVMEYLEGADLATVLQQEGPLPISTAVEYLLQACEGLAEAHAARIVHRDLKPGNLFCARRPDGSAQIKILDFGISKVDNISISGQAAMTATATVLGSPLYMSPEQMESSKNVDHRTDIWALGVVLQQLVTGRPAFDAENLAGLCVMIATRPPLLLTQVKPDAPKELEAVILRCLEKNPDARFADVGELAQALLPFAPQAHAHVDRISRTVHGTPLERSSGAMNRISQVNTGSEAFGRTKTALANSTPDVKKTSPVTIALIAGAGAVAATLTIGLIAWKLKSGPTAIAPTPSTSATVTTTATVPPPPASTTSEIVTAPPSATTSATAAKPVLGAVAPRPSARPSASVTATTAPAAPTQSSGISRDRK